MMQPLRLLALTLTVLALSSCGTFHKVTDKTLGFFKGSDQPAEVLPGPDDPVPPAALIHNTAVMYVDVNGAKRKIVIALDPAVAPKAVANFKKLVTSGFYNGLAFHRAIHNYLVQTGDPATRSDDNRNAWGLTDVGYKLPPELRGKHIRGALAMARQGDMNAANKSSSGSQFYIMLRADPKLDGRYTVFGRVIEGLETLEAISAMTVDTNDSPVRRFEITRVRLVPSSSPETRPEPVRAAGEKERGPVGRFFQKIW